MHYKPVDSIWLLNLYIWMLSFSSLPLMIKTEREDETSHHVPHWWPHRMGWCQDRQSVWLEMSDKKGCMMLMGRQSVSVLQLSVAQCTRSPPFCFSLSWGEEGEKKGVSEGKKMRSHLLCHDVGGGSFVAVIFAGVIAHRSSWLWCQERAGMQKLTGSQKGTPVCAHVNQATCPIFHPPYPLCSPSR